MDNGDGEMDKEAEISRLQNELKKATGLAGDLFDASRQDLLDNLDVEKDRNELRTKVESLEDDLRRSEGRLGECMDENARLRAEIEELRATWPVTEEP